MTCVLAGREGYHAAFLRPIARAMGCTYVELPYLDLYRCWATRCAPFIYVEDVWLYEGDSHAPSPPGALPEAETSFAGRFLPVLGNVHVFFGDVPASEAPCGRAGLLFKAGEPLLTDVFLPLYVETRSVVEALRVARAHYRCGGPASPRDLVQGALNGRYTSGYLWAGWLSPEAGLAVSPYPGIGRAMLGFWGITTPRAELAGLIPRHVWATPPPYLDAYWGPWERLRPLTASAVHLRGPRWMRLVWETWDRMWAYLNGLAQIDEVAGLLESMLVGAVHLP